MNETLVSSKLRAAEEVAALKVGLAKATAEGGALKGKAEELDKLANTHRLLTLTNADLTSSLASIRSKLAKAGAEGEELRTLAGELQDKVVGMNEEKLAWLDEKEVREGRAAPCLITPIHPPRVR